MAVDTWDYKFRWARGGWLTWHCAICKVGRSGGLSGVVVVRTVVSAQSRPLLRWTRVSACSPDVRAEALTSCMPCSPGPAIVGV